MAEDGYLLNAAISSDSEADLRLAYSWTGAVDRRATICQIKQPTTMSEDLLRRVAKTYLEG